MQKFNFQFPFRIVATTTLINLKKVNIEVAINDGQKFTQESAMRDIEFLKSMPVEKISVLLGLLSDSQSQLR